VEQDSYRLLKLPTGLWFGDLCLPISPIVHPQRDPDDPQLTRCLIPFTVLTSGVHSLLASILAPGVPQICSATTLSCLRYLRSGGHSVKTRKSLEPLLKPSYLTTLKMRPWLSRFQKRQFRHSSGHCRLDKQDIHSAWWGDHPLRPHNDHDKIRVPLRFFSYRRKYASNYDLWYTYRYVLLLLPILLANTPPDPQLASIASNCIFNSFCTAHPRETRKAKKSNAQYFSRCRHISTMPLAGRIVVDGMDKMDVD